MKLTLIDIKQETKDVRSFIFEPEKPLTWVAGQFMEYTLPHDHTDERSEKRWFTISSAPFTLKPQITTRLASEKGSSFKNALVSLKIGDEIEAGSPEGDFVIEETASNFVFVAGGIGITPFHSILAQALHDNQKLKVHLLYANKTHDIPFKEEFDEICAKNPNFRVEYIIDPDKINVEKIQSTMSSMQNPVLYISGPEPMVESLVKQLGDSGLTEDHIKTDYFPGYINEYSKNNS
jgi:ferredoxin-NADP reductase